MPESTPDRKMVLVVEEEGLYLAIQRQFAPDKFELVHALSLEQVRLMASIRSLHLVVALISKESVELAWALKDISASRVRVLGLLPEKVDPKLDLSAFAETVSAHDVRGVIRCCCTLLDERRTEPRVAVRFPVILEEMGEGIVQNVSASGLMVYSMMPLTEGQEIKVQVGWGATPLRFSALIGRTDKAALGQQAMVLLVSLDETEARHFLKGLADRILDLHHYLASFNEDPVDDNAKLDDLADLYGLEETGPGSLSISIAQPAPGPLLPEAQLKRLDETDAQDEEDESEKEEEEREREREEEEKKEEEKRKADEKKAGLNSEMLFGSDEKKKSEAEEEEEEEEKKDSGSPKEGQNKSRSGIWALAVIIAAALVTMVAWPKISSWQEDGEVQEEVAPPLISALHLSRTPAPKRLT